MESILNLAHKALTAVAALYVVALIVYLILRAAFGDGVRWLALLNNFAPFYFLPMIVLLAAAALLRIRQMAFLLPFALIGLVWFGPYFLPKNRSLPTGPTMRVLTFNLWDRNTDPRRAMAWIREMKADVVLLQEVQPADVLPDLLDLYPYQNTVPDETRPVVNFMLSRFPILDAESLTDEGLPGQQRLVLEVGGQPVAVYNLHLPFPALSPRSSRNAYVRAILGYDTTARNNQIARLLRLLENEPYPFIVGGDFNTSDQAVVYGELAAVMSDSFREAGSGLGGSWPVSQAHGLPAFIPPLIRIDYIWHSDHFRALEASQGPELGSDHLPLLATLELLPAM
jgi:endonuclease/exonuclease/phosphatase (EEP) superfamily protein YafD